MAIASLLLQVCLSMYSAQHYKSHEGQSLTMCCFSQHRTQTPFIIISPPGLIGIHHCMWLHNHHQKGGGGGRTGALHPCRTRASKMERSQVAT